MKAFLGAVLGLAVATLGACVGETSNIFPSGSSSTGGPSSTSTSSSTATTGSGGGGAGGTGGATTSSTSAGGGGAGAGGTSSSSGTGGAPCSESSDCPGYPGPACAQVACIGGACEVIKPPAGSPTTDTTAGDCHATACDGQGGTIELVDVGDIPEDSNDCTIDACDAQGKAWNTKLPAGASCSSNGGTMCDGAGKCVECLEDADCGDPPSPCDFYFDQFQCQAVPGCTWDSASWWCSGAPAGYACQAGSCV
jgi:hypothetical protein